MNGWITIGSKLDTKQLDKDIASSKRQLAQYEKEAQKLTNTKAKLEIDLQDYEKAKQEIQEATDKSLEFAQTRQQVEFVLETEEMQLNQLNQQYSTQISQLAEVNGKLQENENHQEEIKQHMARTNEEIEKAKKIDEVKRGADGLKNSMKDVVRSAIRWGLAIFGIRTAFNFLKSSISTISSYNEQVGTDIEYIRFALASTLEPVVLRLIGLVKTLLNYINYIAQAWFGINLFAGASTEKFNKSKDALGGAAKNAKEINKQLAGFDEMTVLQDNTDTGGGGGGAGGAMPSFDLSQFEGDIPDWLQWIVDHKDEILATLAGIVGFLTAMKLGLGAITALGIGLIIAGIVLAVEGLLAYLQDPSWENFGKVIIGIGIALVGLAVIIGSLPLAVIGAVVLIYGVIIKYWDEIKAFLQKGIDWLTGQSDLVHKVFGDTIGNIYDAFVNVLSNMLKGWDNTFKAIKRIFDDVIKIVKAIIKGDWKGAWEAAKDIVVTIFNTIVANIKLAFNAVLGIVKSIASAVGSAIWGVIKGAINGIIGMAEDAINSPIRAINGLLSVLNKLPGVSIGKLSTIKLPRLAKGGIINQPGRGVMVGSAVAGERGKEGVIPLTDSQQMELLGEAIGKYITVNASITNTMNGRVISRELKKVQNENDFAFNR